MKDSERGYGNLTQSLDDDGNRIVTYSDEIVGIPAGALANPNMYGFDIREDGLLSADAAGFFVYRPLRFAPTNIIVCERVWDAKPSHRAVLHLDIAKPKPPYLRIRCLGGLPHTTSLVVVDETGKETPVQDIVQRVTIDISENEMVTATVVFDHVELDVLAKEAASSGGVQGGDTA